MLQKSRKITVLMLAILVIYSIVANYSLVSHAQMYYYIVNPLFWFIFIIAASLLLSKTNESTRFGKDVLEYTVIASLIYIGIYIVSQFFIEVGKNPYSTSIKGILINSYIYLWPIIAKEYTRFKLVNNVYEKEKRYMSILVCIVYIFVDIGIIKVQNIYGLAKVIFSDVLPIIANNCLCTYIAFNKMCKPAILYRVISSAYWFVSPVLPKVDWLINSVVDTIIPIILLIYIAYIRSKKDANKSREKVEKFTPGNLISVVVVVVLALWFATGVFPIKPVAVATGSMEKTLMVGDIVILKKCSASDVNEGDIIQYQKGSVTIIHRVLSKYNEKGKIFFITKGDNNKAEDPEPVSESQVLGKQIFSVKYLGLPAVFISRMGSTTNADLNDIETGM